MRPRRDTAAAFIYNKKMEQTALHAHWKLAGWEILADHADSLGGTGALKR